MSSATEDGYNYRSAFYRDTGAYPTPNIAMKPLEENLPNIATGENKAGLPSSPLILGTAQLGMPYGIANKDGKPDYQELLSIIKASAAADILAFDTANAYGDSETRLGEAFEQLGIADKVQVMTKIGANALISKAECIEVVQQSLARLKISRLSVLYWHSWQALDSPSAGQNFRWLKQLDLADSFGVSVYSAKEALEALDLDYIDSVQMPLNVLDRQAIQHGVILKAERLGKRIFFRSIFLQGLLLLPLNQIPQSMLFARDILTRWQEICSAHCMTPHVAALSVAHHLAHGMPLIVGCETKHQLQENIKALKNTGDNIATLVAETAKLAASVPEEMRNPTLWPK